MRTLQEVVSPDAEAAASPRPTHFHPEVGFLFPETRPLRKANANDSFPDSVSGFSAEPSQSAQRPHQILRPSKPADPSAERDDGVCSFLRNAGRGVRSGCHARCARRRQTVMPAARVQFFLRLVVAPPESRPFPPGMPVRIPPGWPFSLRKRRFSIRGRSPLRPLGSE